MDLAKFNLTIKFNRNFLIKIMDILYHKIISFPKIINILLLGCSLLSAIITLKRPDYNLFLFAFMSISYFCGNINIQNKLIIHEMMFFAFVMSLSLIVDYIWIKIHKNDQNISSLFIKLSWLEFAVKIKFVITAFILWLGAKKCANSSDLENNKFNELKEEQI